MTGLTEVTLRKVYKELLENWDDLLPSNYTPAVPPERAFPTTVITSGRSSTSKVDFVEVPASLDREKQSEMKPNKPTEVLETSHHQARVKEDAEGKGNSHGAHSSVSNLSTILWPNQLPFGAAGLRSTSEKGQNVPRGMDIDEAQSNYQVLDRKIDKDPQGVTSSSNQAQLLSSSSPGAGSSASQFRPPYSSLGHSNSQLFGQPQKLAPGYVELKSNGNRSSKQ